MVSDSQLCNENSSQHRAAVLTNTGEICSFVHGRRNLIMKTISLLALSALFLVTPGCGSNENLLLVENNSGTTCTSVTVAVCDSSWTFSNLYSGEEQEVSVVYTNDDSFHVSAQFAGGRTLSGSFGYVTHGITGERIRISIDDESIAFLQSGY
jgi:hypothetical protein